MPWDGPWTVIRGDTRMSEASGTGRNASANPEATGETQEWTNPRASAQAARAANARQLSGRRRFVDPTTCERDYSKAEIEFMQAMQEYKQKSGRMFPTWSEVLEVLKSLGYEKPRPRRHRIPRPRVPARHFEADPDGLREGIRPRPVISQPIVRTPRHMRLTAGVETAYRDPNPFVGKRFRSLARLPRS